MRKAVICLAIVACLGFGAVAQCYNSDSPDCGCFNDTGAWDPGGPWIQDVALDTVGTIESCLSEGGKPFYQMRLGLNSSSAATTAALFLEAFSAIGPIPYEREVWCSETISYWHREAGIPYSTGYRRSEWHLSWQLTNTNAIRTFYMVENSLDLLPLSSGRGRWIDWSDLDYSDFQPGITAPAPGSYVLIRAYDGATATWTGNSHSMMINEMTIHKNSLGDIVKVEVSLLDGNGGSTGQVRDTSTFDDLISFTPAGSEWLGGGRKILGFGVDLDADGAPIFDPDRLHYRQDIYTLATVFKPFPTSDPLWNRFYASLVQRLVDYASETKGGPLVTGPAVVVGKGGIPDGNGISWTFGPELDRAQPKGFEITIDLLRDYPLEVSGILLQWEGSLPTSYVIRYAADGQRYQEVLPPGIGSLKLSTHQLGPVLIPVSFGKESVRVRAIQLHFPHGSLSGEAKLAELRIIYNWGPSEDAEFNP